MNGASRERLRSVNGPSRPRLGALPRARGRPRQDLDFTDRKTLQMSSTGFEPVTLRLKAGSLTRRFFSGSPKKSPSGCAPGAWNPKVAGSNPVNAILKVLRSVNGHRGLQSQRLQGPAGRQGKRKRERKREEKEREAEESPSVTGGTFYGP